MPEPDAEVVVQLRELLGDRGVRIQPDDLLPDIVVKPASTEQVSRIFEICSAAGQAVVPLGGKTGLANGHMQTGNEVGLSLERMNAIEEIDYEALQSLLCETVECYQGSVSAEHGVGVTRREQLHRSRSPAELQLMLGMKKMLDPGNILNPNKFFAADKLTAPSSN